VNPSRPPEGAFVTESDRRLRDFLGAELPEGISALPDADRDALTAVILDARARQARGLQEALGAALKHVPLPLRGIVRKVLIG
jgi:hypothetical protein